jgi:hypothetical protein
MQPLDELVIPEFKNYVVKPNHPACAIIDGTRLMVEILGGLESASSEFAGSYRSSKLIIDGKYALVFRYKRETDEKYHPACSVGFNLTEEGGVHIRHFQGSKDKRVAFRFSSSFETPEYLLKVLEESFMKKGIPVTVERFPDGLEGAADVHRANMKYERLRSLVEGLSRKYASKPRV